MDAGMIFPLLPPNPSPNPYAEWFKKKHRLPFTLVSDPEGEVLKAFGVGKIPKIVKPLARASAFAGNITI